MSFVADWDVDQYKTEHESDEHWELRRNFMLMHKKNFPEERLVCLAQVFTNIEFLGCRYPQETMDLVASLSEGVADEFREKQKTKLQRTFVKASDAAGAKVKGLKRPLTDATESTPVPSKITKHSASSPLTQKDVECDDIQVISTDSPKLFDNKTCNLKNSPVESYTTENCNSHEDLKLKTDEKVINTVSVNSSFNLKHGFKSFRETRSLKKGQKIDGVGAGKFGHIVLLEGEGDTAHSILTRSLSVCRVPFRREVQEDQNKVFYRIYVNDHVVVSVSDISEKIAKDVAVSIAVERLRDVCYTLKIKKHRVPVDLIVEKTKIVSIDINNVKESRAPVPKETALATPLPEDNIGNKLLRSMGWTGGGLGKTEQGIQEPVSVSLRMDRAGLGAQKNHVDASFKTKVRLYLLQYSAMDSFPNLILKSNEFSTMERYTIHQIAKSMGLQSKIIGKGDDARAVISRKVSLVHIAIQMIQQGIYVDDYYEIIKPRGPSDCNFASEVLEASAFPHLCNRKNNGAPRLNNHEGKLPKNQNTVGIEGNSLSKSAARRLKRERRKEKSSRRASSRLEIAKKKQQQIIKNFSLDKIVVGPYGSFFLVEHEDSKNSPACILKNSASYNNICIRYKHGSFVTGAYCKVFVNGHLLTTMCALNKRDAQLQAVNDAYEKLKQICYTLKIKTKFLTDGTVIGKDFTSKKENPTNVDSSLDKPMGDNIGSKLMRSMGWTGGGLGKNEQGIEEPIRLTKQIKRAGLGLPTDPGRTKFRKVIENILKDYCKNDTVYDMIFSSEFSKEERACMHVVARKLCLKSRSYGIEPSRSLVISKERHYFHIVAQMLKSGCFSTPRYELLKPSISLPPENPLNSLQEEDLKDDPDPSTSSVCNDQVSSDSFCPPKGVTSEDNLVLRSHEDETEKASSVGCTGMASELSQSSCKLLTKAPVLFTGQFGRLVLIEDENCTTPVQIIERSANGCHIPFRYHYAQGRREMECKLFINNVVVTSDSDNSKKRAREATVNSGIEKLREICYTLRTQLKVEETTLNVVKTLILPTKRGREEGGSKIESHIVCSSKQVNRATIGIVCGEVPPSMFKNNVRSFLQDYVSKVAPYDLVITPDFSSPERMSIRQIASGLALKSNVHTVTKQEFLVLSKKMSPLETAEAILLFNNCI